MWRLFYVESALLIVVLVIYPAALWVIRGRRQGKPDTNERAMFMPRGSVRAMIALLVVGSFVNVLVLGHHLHHFTEILAAFGTLSGSIIGFYFGTRGAQKIENGNNIRVESRGGA